MKTKYTKYIMLAICLVSLCVVIWFSFIKKSDRDKFADSFKETDINGKLKVTYPHDKSMFPPDIASPSFIWEDPDNEMDNWLVLIEADGKIQFTSEFTNEKKWKPDSSDWEKIKKFSAGKDIAVNIIGVKKDLPGKFYNGGKVQISISKDSVAAPIFFRAVPLPFGFAVDNLPTISWRLASISNYAQPKILLTNFPVCGNCHSFSRDGKTLGMDVDYANDKGAYFVTNVSKHTEIVYDKIMSWNDFKRDENEFTYGLLSQISPDGNYALSTVKDRSIFVRIDNLDYSQLFFPIKGIIAVYDIKNKTFQALKGADDREFCQSNAMWSPDGKTILFAKAPVYHNKLAEKSTEVILPTEYAQEFIDGRKDFKFDIYQVPFNNGNGGEAVPLTGASKNGMSNFFPKYSPDGKWIVFTQAKNFMLLQPDAKLYIMPAQGGTPRLMNCNNPGTMNSWHSWSPNGKWLVFSSKAKGPYTQLYLTHIDEKGNDSPPVLLENMGIRNRAANIPEFVNTKFDDWESIDERFIDNDNYTIVRGKEKLRLKDFNGALKEMDKAIELNFKDDVSLNLRGIIRNEVGRRAEAIEDFTKVIEIKPNSFYAYFNRANVKSHMKDFAGALADMDIAIKMNPQSSREYFGRSEIKFDMGDYKGSIADLNTTLQLNPKHVKAFSLRATAKYNVGDYKGAIKDFDKTVDLNPRDSLVIFKRALSKLQLGLTESAYTDLKESQKLGYKQASEYIDRFYKGR